MTTCPYFDAGSAQCRLIMSVTIAVRIQKISVYCLKLNLAG